MNEKHVFQCALKGIRNLFKRCAIIVMFASFGIASAQSSNDKITGVVYSEENGQPLVGVNIILKEGNKISTSTDLTGAFSIDASIGQTLIVNYIGFVSRQIKIVSNTIKINLKEDISSLKEVVVIGYGKSKRKDLTGAISSVTGEELLKTQPATFDQALQGKVAGLVVQQTSGQPGGGVSVQIRGLSSFGSSSPLYVIDGIIIGGTSVLGSGSNPLATINPSEIEAIDVLKDASATAIYGSQASNGVIVITTKRGKEGAPKISYEFSLGSQELMQTLPTMNLPEFATFINDRNKGIGWGFDNRPEFANPAYLGEGTNWQKELFRTAPMSNHSLTLSGGSNTTQYMVSGSYFSQEGIALGSDFNRASIRINLDNKTTNWLKIGVSFQFAHINENVNATSSNVIQTALSQTPDILVKNPDGSYAGGTDPNGWVNASRMGNPYALALIIKDQPKRNQLFANAYADISFTKNLSFRTEVSGSYSLSTEDKFTPTYKQGLFENNINKSSYEYGQTYYTTLRNFLTYSKVFNYKYNLNVLAGHEAQENTNERVFAQRTGFPSNNVQVISSGDAATATNSGTKGQSAQESYFGRVNFIMSDKYLFTVNGRSDGSSKFASDNRWVATYSGAFAWKLNNENFLKDSKIVNELKPRISYGLTNNQNIRDYAYTTTLTSINNGLSGIAQVSNNLGNPLVEWEKTKYGNAGIDAAFFNWRLSLSFDVYNRTTDGLLLSLPLPLYSGTTTQYSPGAINAPYINVGSVRNKGFDFRISSTNIKNDNFSWKTDVTVSHNENEVLNLNTDGASLYGYYNGNIASKTAVGRSIGEFWGYKTDGVFATEEDFKTHAIPVNPTTGQKLPISPLPGGVWYGDRKFKDLNGDGVIDQKDQTYLGTPLPKYQIGFNNTFTYKAFDLNIFFTANVGNKVLNGLRIQGEDPLTSFGYLKQLNDYAKLALIDPNGSDSDVNNVYVTNPETNIIGIKNSNANENNRISDAYIEDGSFLRCKNLMIGYNMPKTLASKIYMSSLRMYFNVTNAFLISNYKGMDPEIGSWNPLSAGMDGGYYPQPRVFTLGINLGLNN